MERNLVDKSVLPKADRPHFLLEADIHRREAEAEQGSEDGGETGEADVDMTLRLNNVKADIRAETDYIHSFFEML